MRPIIRILVIDDDEVARSSMVMMLTAAGFSVVTAVNGRYGLQACERQLPDLVITDILMPEYEGIETILELRRRYGPIPVLAISGGWRTNSPDLLELVAKLGATGTLAKPFDSDDLLAAIAKCLGGDDADHPLDQDGTVECCG